MQEAAALTLSKLNTYSNIGVTKRLLPAEYAEIFLGKRSGVELRRAATNPYFSYPRGRLFWRPLENICTLGPKYALMNAEEQRKHKGDLRWDSPAVYAVLEYAFPQNIEILAQAYSLAWQHGGASDSPVIRAVGASFNPRPARLVSLLLSEGQEKSPLAVSAAFLASSSLSKELVSDSPLLDAWVLAQEAINRHQSAPSNPAACKIAVCLEIDLLRHLHMTDLSDAERKALTLASAAISEHINAGAQAARLSQIYNQILKRRLGTPH